MHMEINSNYPQYCLRLLTLNDKQIWIPLRRICPPRDEFEYHETNLNTTSRIWIPRQIHSHIHKVNHPACTPSECTYLSLPEPVFRTLQCWPPSFGAVCIAVGVGQRTVVIPNTSDRSHLLFPSVTAHRQYVPQLTRVVRGNRTEFVSSVINPLKIRLTWTTFKYPARTAQ